MVVHMFVLGIDPGLTRCGYGVVEQLSARRTSAVAALRRASAARRVPRPSARAGIERSGLASGRARSLGLRQTQRKIPTQA